MLSDVALANLFHALLIFAGPNDEGYQASQALSRGEVAMLRDHIDAQAAELADLRAVVAGLRNDLVEALYDKQEARLIPKTFAQCEFEIDQRIASLTTQPAYTADGTINPGIIDHSAPTAEQVQHAERIGKTAQPIVAKSPANANSAGLTCTDATTTHPTGEGDSA